MKNDITDPRDPLYIGPATEKLPANIAQTPAGLMSLDSGLPVLANGAVDIDRLPVVQSGSRHVNRAEVGRLNEALNTPRQRKAHELVDILRDPVSGLAVTPKGEVLRLKAALEAGYAPLYPADLGADAVRTFCATVRGANPNLSEQVKTALFAAEVCALPQAEGRQSFAVDVAQAYRGKWTAKQAAAYLAGLPKEDGTTPRVEVKPRPGLHDRVAAAAVELRSEGHSAAEHAQGRNLDYALEIERTTGTDIASALRSVNVDPTTI